MSTEHFKRRQYRNAVKKVKAIRSFYVHLAIFIFLNSIIILAAYFNADNFDKKALVWAISSFTISWIVGLIIHAYSAFGNRLIFTKSWEERKMQEIIEKDEDKIWD